MTRGTSLYLDLVRFAAAMTVLLGHFSHHRISGGLFWQVDLFGSNQAVMVFFVLSGFVVAYVTDARERTPRDYAISRAARIYSVALPALLAVPALDWLGRTINPAAYDVIGPTTLWGFVAHLLFLNEAWLHHIEFGSLYPYWSLGYEVWYYAVFGVAIFTPAPWSLPAAGLVLLAIGPNVAALFPVWLMGWGCYRLSRRRAPAAHLPAILLIAGPILGWVAFEWFAWRSGLRSGITPLYEQRWQIWQNYVLGLLFSLHLLGITWRSEWVGAVLARPAAAIRWLAGATFTIYLFHFPVMMVLLAVCPWPGIAARRVFLLAGTLVCVFLIAEVTERRKAAWRRLFTALLGRPRTRAAASAGE